MFFENIQRGLNEETDRFSLGTACESVETVHSFQELTTSPLEQPFNTLGGANGFAGLLNTITENQMDNPNSGNIDVSNPPPGNPGTPFDPRAGDQ